ncbi:MAG: pyridoxal phosphate-dependent aminotransferase [Alphaproteobacteria bacterium]
MALKIARRGMVPPFIVMDVMRAANAREAEGESVCHLEVGQPATSAPRGVIAAARGALETDVLGYTEALGAAPLRARIARHYAETYGIEISAERVVVTTGSSGGFLLSFLAAFDAGDRVALADPGYPAYRNILTALGVEPVCLPATAETRFQPTVDLLAAQDGALDGLIVASPSNPAGTMLGRDELSALAVYCADAGIRLVSDEIYHGITYGRDAVTALAVSDQAIVINSFSKYYSMTGWRLGWMVVPEDMVRAIECLAQNLFISPPSLSQHAGVAAFECGEELDANVAHYARNRDILLAGLPKAGLARLAPADGAFYLYADVSHLTEDSRLFCQRMLSEAGIAATPGVDFDRARGHGFVRFSFAGATAEIETAVRRLREWLGGEGAPATR